MKRPHANAWWLMVAGELFSKQYGRCIRDATAIKGFDLARGTLCAQKIRFHSIESAHQARPNQFSESEKRRFLSDERTGLELAELFAAGSGAKSTPDSAVDVLAN
jgi:hypothetical protein